MFTRIVLLPMLCSVAYAAEPAVPVEVKTGQQTSVVLASNPSTGYSWQVAEPLRASSPVAVELSYIPQPKNKMVEGAPVPTKVSFTGKRVGAATVRLIYVRPWEKDTPPAKETIFQVTVSR